ncbi:alpha/beta hydrolase [Sinomonas cellulolyticus]|jgi:predicted alpha/beta-hydrolase family hydrolase|uniref:Dienelactone hydrolase n=1 Tax=Sinomonas cellulolyticus TaxID=2801916 RepID=A0ABS1K0D3_9MICC|nr:MULTISPECIES: alpha/beta family hydrolase [Sinomonas]MBL0705121.1 dienelactone hydrolase [Sinomonas cellulolyticus]GHG39386.1 alpha/beta hydrolase [Sinomonas sp. KCTC 49339]
MADGERMTIPTPSGDVSGVYVRPGDPRATVVVAHGAGAGMDHPFLVGYCDALNRLGLATLRFNFAYMEAGKRAPDRAPKAVPVWTAALAEARRRSAGEPLWGAGKSFGGRMASMAAAEGAIDPAGLVFLGYPLHPAGKPEKLRDEHLYGLTLPMLFLSGTRDALATADLLAGVVARLPSAELVWLEGGDHSFAVKGVKRTPYDIGASLAEPTARFVARA